MIRCVALATALFACTLPAAAQAPRNFPATALRGEIVVTQPPELLLNGQPARLAPGARIRAQNNLLQVSGALVNQRLAVNYTLDLYGLLLDVWVLTPQELARRPWPTTPAQAATWRFDAAAQTWSRP
ncbi:MAG: hypothetical protein Q8K96_00405 [Rubrivivax sp.]|nr:hypothetical protein [Rubrivivax sp.]